jgi:hypothetical protein
LGGLCILWGKSFNFSSIVKSSNDRYLGLTGKHKPRLSAKNRKWEITMRKTILTVVSASVIATLTAQAAAASEHHHVRTKGGTVASEQWRNSNAYAAPRDIAVPSYWSNLDEGAMSSGMAGH